MQIVITELNKVHSYCTDDSWSINVFPEGYSIVELGENESEQDFLTNNNIDHELIKITDLIYNPETKEFSLSEELTDRTILEKCKTLYIAKIKRQYMNLIQWTDDYTLWYTKKSANNNTSLAEDMQWEDVKLYWKEANDAYVTIKESINVSETCEEIKAIEYAPVFTKEKEDI